MRILMLFTLLSYMLYADFFPQSRTSRVVSILNSHQIKLSSTLPKGMSGIVIHDYGKGIRAITAKVAQHSLKYTSVLDEEVVPHKRLPKINTEVKVGDTVIGGYLYESVLLLAPNAQIYAEVTSSYQKRWVHPDIFALYLAIENEKMPTKENLKAFAQKYQIGLIYIVKRDKEILLDALSGEVVSSKPSSFSFKEAKSPFYMRFKELDNSWIFKEELPSYDTIMEKI